MTPSTRRPSPSDSPLRVGIPVTYQFSVRYLLHTGMLDTLAERVQPVILTAWQDRELEAALVAVGCEVAPLPVARFGPRYLRHRRLVEVLHERRLASPSTPIDNRRRDAIYPPVTRLRRLARRDVHRALAALPGGPRRILAAEQRLALSDTNLAEVGAALAPLRLDAMVSVTPYHRLEEPALRWAHTSGLPVLCSIISFDNPTTRGWLATPCSRYLVWNDHMRRELLRSLPPPPAGDTGRDRDGDRIVVTGAPQFDLYHRPRWSEARWRDALGLTEGRPVVLFAAGPEVIVPHEPHLLAQLDVAVSTGELPGRPVILFRRHPMDRRDRWNQTLSRCTNVVVDDPWAVQHGRPEHSVPTMDDIDRMTATLAHSSVHVATSSTMTVDGAYFDRPQVGPAYDDRPGSPAQRQITELYEREHWLPITASGGMTIARSRNEFVRAVAQGLTDPGRQAAGRRRLVASIVTFADGRSTDRVVSALLSGLLEPGSGRGE